MNPTEHDLDPGQEERVRRAFRAHADRMEPSADGLRRLRERADEQRGALHPPAGPARFAAAAAVVLLGVAGVGFLATRGSGTSGVDAVDGGPTTTASTTTTMAEAPATTTTMAFTTTTETTPPTVPVVETWYDPAPSVEEAGARFLAVLGWDGQGRVDADGRVWTSYEGGEEIEVASLGWAADDDGYWITNATSSDVVITSPQVGAEIWGDLVVTGRGTGFEATVVGRAVRTDGGTGTVVGQGFASAGNFGELAGFEMDLHAPPSGTTWVVAQSATGVDSGIPAFAAVRVQGPTDPHRVYRIPPDDPDGGLRLRAEMGVVGDSLAVLPSGTVVEVIDREGGEVEGTPWAVVRTEDGTQGWVSASYLTPTGVTDPGAELIATVAAGGFEDLPWVGDRPVVVGYVGAARSLTADQLRDPATWDEPFVLEVSQYEPTETTLRGLLRIRPEGDPIVERVDAATASPYGLDQQALASWFGGRRVTLLRSAAGDGSGWTNLVLVTDPDGEVLGLLATIWTP